MKKNVLMASSLAALTLSAHAADYFVLVSNRDKIPAPAVSVQLLDFAFPSFRPGIKQSFDVSTLASVTGDPGYDANLLTWSGLNLPSGFTLSNKQLTGQAAAAGSPQFTLSATYKGVIGSKVYQFTVAGTPVLSDVVSFSGSFCNSFAVTGNGNLYAWGLNCSTPSLGNGSYDSMYTAAKPIQINTGEPMAYVSSGRGYNTCAVAKAGSVYCWGDNTQGQLGDGTSGSVINVPTKVLNVTNAVQVTVSYKHGCAVTSDGRLMCWGKNTNGQFFDAAKIHASTIYTAGYADLSMLNPGEKAVQVVADDNTTCIRTDLGRIYCAGSNNLGQLGQGNNNVYTSGVHVASLGDGVTSLTSSFQTFCGIKAGQAYCWGGKPAVIGTAWSGASSTPVLQAGLTNVTELGFIAGTAGTVLCAVSNGNASCWGANSGNTKFFPASGNVVAPPGNTIASNVGPDFKFASMLHGYSGCYAKGGNLRCATVPAAYMGEFGLGGDGSLTSKLFNAIDYVSAP